MKWVKTEILKPNNLSCLFLSFFRSTSRHEENTRPLTEEIFHRHQSLKFQRWRNWRHRVHNSSWRGSYSQPLRLSSVYMSTVSIGPTHVCTHPHTHINTYTYHTTIHGNRLTFEYRLFFFISLKFLISWWRGVKNGTDPWNRFSLLLISHLFPPPKSNNGLIRFRNDAKVDGLLTIDYITFPTLAVQSHVKRKSADECGGSLRKGERRFGRVLWNLFVNRM